MSQISRLDQIFYFLVKQELSIVNMTYHIRFSHFLPIFQIIVIYSALYTT